MGRRDMALLIWCVWVFDAFDVSMSRYCRVSSCNTITNILMSFCSIGGWSLCKGLALGNTLGVSDWEVAIMGWEGG